MTDKNNPAKTDAKPTPRKKKKAPPKPRRISRRRVLFVDDMELPAAVLGHKVCDDYYRKGIEIVHCRSAAEVMQACLAAKAAGEGWLVWSFDHDLNYEQVTVLGVDLGLMESDTRHREVTLTKKRANGGMSGMQLLSWCAEHVPAEYWPAKRSDVRAHTHDTPARVQMQDWIAERYGR